MDTETYRQAVSESAAGTAELVAALARVVLGAAAIAVCLWVWWVWGESVIDRVNVLLARFGAYSRPSVRFDRVTRPRRPVGRLAGAGSGLRGLFGFVAGGAVRATFAWPVAGHLAALLTASATVGVGVLLHGLHRVEVQNRSLGRTPTRRFWSRSPEQMARTLGNWITTR